tara:strand:+ start:2965 stop:3597 length:633 start_codon:yes stop_codon:yes gene_type:complete
MRNPYTINPQDISPEMVTSLLEGRIAEAARVPKVLPTRRTPGNIASIIAGLDLSTEAGRNRKALLLQRDKAQKLDKRDALAGKTHGTVSRPDGTTKLGSKDVKIASDEDARDAQNPEDLENSHNTYDSDDNSIRLEKRVTKSTEVAAVEEELKVAPNLQKVAKMTQSEKERAKIAAQRQAYNDSKVKVESFKQYSEKTHKGLKRRTVTGA